MPKKQTYETAVAKLTDIVSQLEDPETPLETSVKLYQEGIELAAFCAEKLTKAEGEVTILKQTATGLFRKEALDE